MPTRQARPLLIPEQTAPGTPPTGWIYVYGLSDGKVYRKDDAGVQVELGGGGGAPTYPLLAPNGTITNPSYSFTNDPDTGMWLDGVGAVRVVAGGQWKIYAADDGTNGSVWLDARGTGNVIFRHGTVPKVWVLADRVSVVPPLALNEQATPATPPASEVWIYAKTDKKAYAKDSAGVETLLSNDDDVEFLAMWGAFA